MKKRISTSELKPNILHRIFKKASVERCVRKLTSKHGRRIPFSKVREYNNVLVHIALREDGYVPNHDLQLYYKI